MGTLSDIQTNTGTAIADDTGERIVETALNLFLEFGYRRTTMDTVARRMGVSRVTVYRHYSDKAALFQAVMLRELQTASADIESHLNSLTIEQNPVVEGFVLAVTLARRNRLICRLLDTEPEWLVLHMTVQGEQVLQWSQAAASAFLHQPKFAGWLKTEELDVAAEIMVRLLLSSMLTPGGRIASDDPDALRRVAGYLIQPLLR